MRGREGAGVQIAVEMSKAEGGFAACLRERIVGLGEPGCECREGGH